MTAVTEEFADRVFASALGAIEIYSIHIGDRLGFYRALARGPKTSRELAEATQVHERYVREWLEQQATNGIVTTDLSSTEPIFSLPPSHSEVLADELNGFYLAPLARMLTTAGEKMPMLLDAYRDGSGVSWDAFGQDMRESQADMNRPFFTHDLTGAIAGLEGAHQRLTKPGARAADVGCGAGWSTIALATAYPEATFHGYDVDPQSIEAARDNATAAGLSDRVSFSTEDIGAVDQGQTFDVAFVFEAIHDMPRPVDVLTAMHGMVRKDGVVVVMDEAVGDEFTGEGDEIEKLMYGFSLLICLPDGLSSQPSVGTGTVMRPATLESYANDAGFTGFQPLSEVGFFRFYELKP